MQFEYDPEKLITEVKKRPGIWDFETTEYRSKVMRHKLWTEVVSELLQSDIQISKSEMRELEIQLQKKWKSIRDCFQKYLQNPSRTKKPYLYSKHLQFLLKNDTKKNDDRASSSSEETSKPKRVWKSKRKLTLPKDESTSEEETENNDVYDNEESQEFLTDEIEIPVKKSRISNKPAPSEFVFASVDTQVKYDPDDPDRMFLLSLLPHLKSIPDDLRINVKMDLMQVLRNAI